MPFGSGTISTDENTMWGMLPNPEAINVGLLPSKLMRYIVERFGSPS